VSVLRRRGDESGWALAEHLAPACCAHGRRVERLEAEFLDGNAELRQLGLVRTQQVVVRLQTPASSSSS